GSLRGLSRERLDGTRSRSWHCGPVSELSGAADVRYAKRGAPRRVDRSDETGRRQAHGRGPGRHQRLRRVAGPERAIEEFRTWLRRTRLPAPLEFMRTANA